MGVKKFNPNPGHKKNILAAFQVPSNLDPELQQFLQSVKESVENASGNRGQPLERFVTLQELQDVGLINTVVKNRRGEIGGTATESATGASAAVPPAFFPFGDLIDVLLTAPTDGQIPTYNAATTKWVNTTLTLSALGLDDINHQQETYEGMSERFLISSEFTDPPVPGVTPNLKTATAGAGALVGGNIIDPMDHPGIWTLSTGTTAAGRVFIHSIAGGTTVGTLRIGTGGKTRVGTWLRTGANLSTAPERYTIRSGLSSMTLPNVLAEGVTFEYDDSQNGGRWQAICGDAPGVETSVDTGITVVADTWYKLEFEVNVSGTSVEFFIDDASVAVIITNIPAGTGFHLFYSTHIMKLIGTTNRDMHIDAMYAYQDISR